MHSNKTDKSFRGTQLHNYFILSTQLLHTQNYRPVTGVEARITVSPTSATQVTCYITQRVKWPHSHDLRTCTQKKRICRKRIQIKEWAKPETRGHHNETSIRVTILNYSILCRSLMSSTNPLYALSRLIPNWAYLGFLAPGAVGRGKKKNFSEPPTRADRPKSFTWDWGKKKSYLIHKRNME